MAKNMETTITGYKGFILSCCQGYRPLLQKNEPVDPTAATAAVLSPKGTLMSLSASGTLRL